MAKLAKVLLIALLALSVQADTVEVCSPDGAINVTFSVDEEGMRWSLSRGGRTVVEPSPLGLEFCAEGPLTNLTIVAKRTASADSEWETKLYRRAKVRDHYNELTVDLEESTGETPRKLTMVFRAYDEGAAFRYVIPEQDAFEGFALKNELTQWRFGKGAEGWTTSYRNEHNGQEQEFVRGKLSEIAQDLFVGMPVVVESTNAVVAICEAALSNWAGLYYKADGEGGLKAHLTRLPKSDAQFNDLAVIGVTPAESPWRVAIVGKDSLDLLRKNDIIQNLNPPPEGDFSWVKSGASSWDWWVESNNSLSTELTLKLIDLAAEMGWPYHTVDGGWYGFARRPNHGPNVKLEPRKNFDLEKVMTHAREKNVGIWLWMHWELMNDFGIEETFERLEKWGVKGVKLDFLLRQDQWMVNWCEKVCRVAAKHRIMVNFHGSFKPTGTERTWPNNLTREAVLGNEMSLFGDRITAQHCATLPFTRLLLGPADFTPGTFANVYSKDFVSQAAKGHRYGDETDRCPHWGEAIGTRAYSLALCVAYDSPLMTLCDWPERYRGADGIDALQALPTTWKATTPIEGKCGEYYSVVRETHDGRFYYASFTAKRRNADLKLDFLGDGEWMMRVFADDSELTPGDAKEIALGERKVKKGDRIGFCLRAEGGAVAIFEKVGEK